MSSIMISACGLTCSECPAFVATQAGDDARIREVAAEWAQMYGAAIGPEHVYCDGCLAEGRKCAHCGECKIRACVIGRGIDNCAACEGYACDELTAFFAMAPHARATLEGLRA